MCSTDVYGYYVYICICVLVCIYITIYIDYILTIRQFYCVDIKTCTLTCAYLSTSLSLLSSRGFQSANPHRTAGIRQGSPKGSKVMERSVTTELH